MMRKTYRRYKNRRGVMPKGRMLNKKISYDERVAKLSLPASLLYTWSIPHLDVKGRIYGDPVILKGTVVPYVKDLSLDIIESALREIETVGLVQHYGNGQKFLEFVGFSKNQKLRVDREKDSEIPDPEQYGLQSKSGVSPEELQVKLSKDKIREDKLTTVSLEVIQDLNEVLGTDYKPNAISTKKLISARLADGYTVEDFKKVHRNMKKEWQNDTKMCKFLRPDTLYTGKMGSYVNILSKGDRFKKYN
jgi:uncharacterized phage protein (TIGR02220 family)